MKQTTCLFTGHRRLPLNKIESIIIKLDNEIERLIAQGVTNFISGGGLGFDQIAASMIVIKKEMGKDIRLIFTLPCRNQDEYWTLEQKQLYHNLLDEADEVRYVSEEYHSNCMKLRNYDMVDHSDYCICALIRERSGTGQTVRYAHKKGVKVINVAD